MEQTCVCKAENYNARAEQDGGQEDSHLSTLLSSVKPPPWLGVGFRA